MATSIKKVTPADLKTLQDIMQKTFAQTFGADNTPEDMEKYFQENYNNDLVLAEINDLNSGYYFLVKDSQVAGYLKLNIKDAQTEPNWPKAMEVQRIYLLDEFQHQGLGTKLIDFAHQRAKELQISQIWLGVWERNENAKRFYAKFGFKKAGEHVFVLGDDRQVDYLMLKEI